MGRFYWLNMGPSTLSGTGIGTILFVNPGAARTYELVRLVLGQTGTETADMIHARLSRQVSTFPTLVTTNATLGKLDANDAASALTLTTTGAAGTVGVNASAEGAGAKTAVLDLPFLNTAGLDVWFPEGERIILPGGDTSGLALHLLVAPASLTLWSAGMLLLER